MKQRNSSIELLRIICAIMVIFLHYNGDGGKALYLVEADTINQYWLYVLESISIIAVPEFVLISGYYLCDTECRNYKKIVELVFLLIIYRQVNFWIGILLGSRFFDWKTFIICLLPANYYVILYAVLYIISPSVNKVVNAYSLDALKKNVIMLICIFSIYATIVDALQATFFEKINGLSPIGLYGSQNGFTIVNFVILYCVGACIKRMDINMKTSTLVVLACVLIAIITCLSYLEDFCGISQNIAWEYCSPFVISLASIALIIFTRLEIHMSIINKLSKASYFCYLVHWNFFAYLKVSSFVNRNVILLVFHQFISAIVIYLFSYFTYVVWNYIKEKCLYFCKRRIL